MFPVFKELPAEIRAVIWLKALPGPQMLELQHNHANTNHTDPVMQGYFDANYDLPSLLLACKESRHIVLMHYQPYPSMTPESIIYIDPLTDIVIMTPNTNHLPSMSFIGNAPPVQLPRGGIFSELQRICLADSWDIEIDLEMLPVLEVLDGFPSVRDVVLGLQRDGLIGVPLFEDVVFEENELVWWKRLCENFASRYAAMGKDAPTLRFRKLTRIIQ